jgi:hypothetical protein
LAWARFGWHFRRFLYSPKNLSEWLSMDAVSEFLEVCIRASFFVFPFTIFDSVCIVCSSLVLTAPPIDIPITMFVR